MKENNIEDIIKRINTVFKNKTYQNRLKTSRRNWIGTNIEEILSSLLSFFNDLKTETFVTI